MNYKHRRRSIERARAPYGVGMCMSECIDVAQNLPKRARRYVGTRPFRQRRLERIGADRSRRRYGRSWRVHSDRTHMTIFKLDKFSWTPRTKPSDSLRSFFPWATLSISPFKTNIIETPRNFPRVRPPTYRFFQSGPNRSTSFRPLFPSNKHSHHVSQSVETKFFKRKNVFHVFWTLCTRENSTWIVPHLAWFRTKKWRAVGVTQSPNININTFTTRKVSSQIKKKYNRKIVE